ncbi:class I adenylate-forming enzyme family protein [Rhodococcus opacus]|uniref:AMP-binding protein n=1 Tax=Rhodococcus opacus TaxID=37919 RepID=A0AAX3YFW8_RHOOP|nr:AMP-binding protein [Rhodococcus opacus]MCZ4583449.1 AMP-binding protein [Rhodococcus opacus]MDJ0415599.1 AMP-binding protein [Rhodococcus opacus]NHU46267.1 long-chain fatty acid--CoA ligase [Rhodococcus sp. A14]WLF47175.1 AMP-binding protein [Rhodococcus opacus]
MITDYFDAGAARYPDRTFLQSDTLRLSYRDVVDASHAIAHGLTREGLASSRIGILSPNHPDGFVAMLGILRAGATYVPLNARDQIEDLIWFMRFTKMSALVYHEQYLPHIDRIRSEVPTLTACIAFGEHTAPGLSTEAWKREHSGQTCTTRRDLDDIALIKSSGGTTGRPKAIMQSHRCLLAAYRIANQFTVPAKDPVHLVVAPLTHAAGATAMGLSAFGTRNVIAPSTDPATVLELIERERVTHLFLPPTMIYRILAHPDVHTRDCSSLEYVIYGAAPMSVDKLEEGLKLWGQVFVQFYGQSEAPGVITCLSRQDHYLGDDSAGAQHLASAGRPTGACEVALMDEGGNFVPAGERGEIVVRGELVCPGYLDNPEANAEAHRFGWHHTGDIGVFDESGYLSVVDRTKDVVISGGFNIYPSEIEQLIWSHPAVQDCAVVGVPDEDWGERLTAVIELKSQSEATAENIMEMCRNRFGSMKTPKQVEFWESLPRSAVGKVLKKDVRAKIIAAHLRAD